MEENDLSNKKNHSNPKSHPKVEMSNQTTDISLQASSYETKDDEKGSSVNFRNPNETSQIHMEHNQKIQFNSVPNPPNHIYPPYTNIDMNIVKKNQPRNRNINPNSGPGFTQQAMMSNNMNPGINLISNLSNPNMGMMPVINLNGNTNPNSPYFTSNLITNNINLNQNSQSTPIGPISTPKKEKNKEKKDKNIKKVIKEKREKTKTKKFHQINKNKTDSNSDNDADWSRGITRRNSSTGSERSVRRNTDILHQQNSGNPLDVWVMSLPFFKPLPTESEIEKYCGNIDNEMVDQSSEINSINSESLPKYKHWSSSMKDVVFNTINSSASQNNSSLETQKSAQQTDADQNLSKSTYKDYFFNSYRLKNKESVKPSHQNNSGILFPPEQFPELTDISSFWLQNAQEFPVTDLQMQNYSIMDNILSAFVVAEPDKTHDKFLQEVIIKYDSPFSIKNDENDDEKEKEKNSSIEDEDDCFLPTHVPAPHLEYDDYLSHSFEEKLEMELQSIGFKRPRRIIHINNSMAQDIEEYRNEIKKIQPTIDLCKQEILSNLGTYKKDEERRRIEMQKYNDLLPKKHKK